MDYNNKWVRDAARQWINDLVQDGTIPASYATKTHTPDYQPPVSPSQAPHQPYSEQIAEKIARNARHIFLETNPVYRVGETFGTLHAAKQEMDAVNAVGYDNYAHRLGMCINGQGGPDQYIYGAFLGGLKEGYDIVRKIWKGHPVIETLQDSYKDMDNTIEALNYGLLHPNDNCRNWLKDFDYKNNRWRK